MCTSEPVRRCTAAAHGLSPYWHVIDVISVLELHIG
jgi:hypothetical protein